MNAVVMTERSRSKEDEAGKLIWECPNCGNQNQDKLFVARRTCGYIGTQFWKGGEGRKTQEEEFFFFNINEDMSRLY